MITLEIDYDLLAAKMCKILDPQIARLESLISKEDKDYVTVTEAMKILRLKSRQSIYRRVDKRELTRFGTGAVFLLLRHEVENLPKKI